MKRSVAIYGPTPQFVRWAIGRPCPIREHETENLPDASFRQLRGLREFSIGLIQDRVFEGICVHPNASADEISAARGFAGEEVLDSHGGESVVAGCCGGCPANALNDQLPGVWGGCYGWLPATTGFCFEATLKQTNTASHRMPPDQPGIDIVRLIDETIEQHSLGGETDQFFNRTSPRWYGLWGTSVIHKEKVAFLFRLFELVVARCLELNETQKSSLSDVIRFRDALLHCVTNDLTMHLELMPPGVSDGQTWSISAHCPECKFEMKDHQPNRHCQACGRKGNPHGVRKSKVLGLRPYVQLEGVLGRAKTADFLKRYEARK